MLVRNPCLHLLPLPREGEPPLSMYDYYRFYKCMNFTNLTSVIETIEEGTLAMQRQRLPPMLCLAGAFAILILLGAFLNLLLIGVVCSRRELRTSSHYAFVLNLACSDLLLCVVTQPLNLLRLLQPHYGWLYGSALCKLGNLLTGVNLFVSTFSVSAIALDRFHAIVHPSTSRVSRSRLKAFVLLIWGLGLLMASPLAWLAKLTQNRGFSSRRVYLCSEDTGAGLGTSLKLAYSCVTLAVQFLIPLTVLLVAYARIGRVMQRRHPSIRQPSRSTSEYRRRRSRREHRKQTRAKLLLVLTVGQFAVSWCPLTIQNIYMDVATLRVQSLKINFNNSGGGGGTTGGGAGVGGGSSEGSDIFNIPMLQGGCLLLLLLSACANPALHGFFSENFRSEFDRIFRRNRRSRKNQTNIIDEADAIGKRRLVKLSADKAELGVRVDESCMELKQLQQQHHESQLIRPADDEIESLEHVRSQSPDKSATPTDEGTAETTLAATSAPVAVAMVSTED